MSLRQIQKQLDKQKQDSDQVDFDQQAQLEKELLKEKQSKKPNFSAFQMLSDSEEDNEEEVHSDNEKKKDTGGEEQKKKKKKNKKKKKPTTAQEGEDNKTQQQPKQQDKKKGKQEESKSKKGSKPTQDDDAFLDQLLSKVKEESKHSNQTFNTYGGVDSVLKMEKKHFNYKKELKMLFAKSAQAFGALGLDDEEEKKNRGTDLSEHYEGASKKMKRRLKMVERQQEKSRLIQTKKYLMVQPSADWPRVDKILSMEQVRTDKKTGQKVFSFVKSPEYVILQKEFETVQRTNDIGQLMEFLRRNFYHHESLVYFADFLRIQGKFSDSFHFLERCLFAFEQAWTFDFQPVPPEKSSEEHFVPQTRLDLDREHLNKVFCDCLVKYIDILGRKGCSRTSVEYCKFLFSICPYLDPYGALLRIDFYALRAHDYSLFLNFVRQLPLELYPDATDGATLLILPNMLMSVGLAKYHQSNGGETYKIQNLDDTLSQLLNMQKKTYHLYSEGNFNKVMDLAPEAAIIAAILLYPSQVETLMRKVAQKQINTALKKAHFNGYQTKTWTEILAHELFTSIGDDIPGQHTYTWLLSQEEQTKLTEDKQQELMTETLHKIYQIYVSRSHTLYSPEHILIWMKEIIGFVLNKIDAGELDRDLLIAKVTSLVQSPFTLSRYRSLKVSDFTDDITTINANELLLGAAGGGVGQLNEFGGAEADQQQNAMAAQQLQHMINQLNQPMPRHGAGGRGGMMMMPQQHQQHLIEDRNFDGMSEQEMIAMQEAILAQMGDNEDIYVDDDEHQEAAGGGGIVNFFNQMIWGNQQQPPREEEKKE